MDFLLWTMNQDEFHQDDQSSGEITPFIKEELKWTILNNRHKKGLGDIDLNEQKPVPKCELSDREKDRKERRKAQNRRAAERCRKKKQKMNEQLLQDFTLEQQKTQQLMDEIKKLRREKEQLQALLNNHAYHCQLSDGGTPNTTPGYERNPTFEFPASSLSYTQDARDVNTPFQEDPFDHMPVMQPEPYFYPQQQYTELKTEVHTDCAIPPMDAPLPELQLTDELDLFQPVSPEMRLGRQSISEYLADEEFLAQ